MKVPLQSPSSGGQNRRDCSLSFPFPTESSGVTSENGVGSAGAIADLQS